MTTAVAAAISPPPHNTRITAGASFLNSVKISHSSFHNCLFPLKLFVVTINQLHRFVADIQTGTGLVNN
jgi:hypothetical protein